jgi:hypothetical protein
MTGCLQISNDGMAALTAFQRLSCLTLEGCIGVSDAGIAHIVTLQHLTDLDFGACDDITDSVRPQASLLYVMNVCVPFLDTSPGMMHSYGGRWLHVCGCRAGSFSYAKCTRSTLSQALESLASVTSLAVLNVMDCSVSDEAVVALRKALPRLAVSHTRAPEGYWELILTDTEVRHALQLLPVAAKFIMMHCADSDMNNSAVLSWLQDEFDDLNGEEWEVSPKLRSKSAAAQLEQLIQTIAESSAVASRALHRFSNTILHCYGADDAG